MEQEFSEVQALAGACISIVTFVTSLFELAENGAFRGCAKTYKAATVQQLVQADHRSLEPCPAEVGHLGGVGERRPGAMPLYYIDHHKNLEGLTAQAVAEDHKKALKVQLKHGVKALRYWFNEEQSEGYCLLEAPSAEAAEAVHREAHANVAAKALTRVKRGESRDSGGQGRLIAMKKICYQSSDAGARGSDAPGSPLLALIHPSA